MVSLYNNTTVTMQRHHSLQHMYSVREILTSKSKVMAADWVE